MYTSSHTKVICVLHMDVKNQEMTSNNRDDHIYIIFYNIYNIYQHLYYTRTNYLSEDLPLYSAK